jgi:hypothetical protein
MNPQLSVKDIMNSMKKRDEKRKLCFDRVLEMCHKKIQKSASLNMPNCFYEVPEFMLGYPLYNINECIVHVLNQLQKSGFAVKYIFPRILHVSWETEQVKEEKLARDLLQLMHAQQDPLYMQHVAIQNMQPLSLTHSPMTSPSSPYLQQGLPPPQSTSINRSIETKTPKGRKAAKKTAQTKPIAEYKPSGKFVLNLT